MSYTKALLLILVNKKSVIVLAKFLLKGKFVVELVL